MLYQPNMDTVLFYNIYKNRNKSYDFLFVVLKVIFLIILIKGSFPFAQVLEGYTLISRYSDDLEDYEHNTLLISNDGDTINYWLHDRGVASMSYLLRDSTLLYPFRVENPSMCNGGVGGGLIRYSWDGEILWQYEFSDNKYQHHHDISPLPSGNILVLAWERHPEFQDEGSEYYGGLDRGWADMGRVEVENPLNQMWSEAIFEIEMIGTNDFSIVWEWHLWDHLIQDIDPNKPNYGVVSNHFELLDINYGSVGSFDGMCGPQADWIHFNSIDYNHELNQIVISSRYNNEIYIIDHSTTTEEAATHSGGNSGRGGDFLYRWGNPETYGQGTLDHQILEAQHGVNWIPQGFPGEGNLLLFNNFHGDWLSMPVNDWQSAVYEIEPPLIDNFEYQLNGEGFFGPSEPVWIATGEFFSFIQSGAFRLPNGNTLVTVATETRIFEVNSNGQISWEYQMNNDQMVARAQKYSLDYLFPPYTIGDANFDQILNIQDALIIHDMFSGCGYALAPTADFNGDWAIDILDIESLIQNIMAMH